jgi:hypothetical protein
MPPIRRSADKNWRMMLHRRDALSDGIDALPANIATAETVGRMEIASGPGVVRVGGGSGAAAPQMCLRRCEAWRDALPCWSSVPRRAWSGRCYKAQRSPAGPAPPAAPGHAGELRVLRRRLRLRSVTSYRRAGLHIAPSAVLIATSGRPDPRTTRTPPPKQALPSCRKKRAARESR